MICKKCLFGLSKFKEFKTEIAQKRDEMRQLAMQEVTEAKKELTEEEKKRFESKDCDKEEVESCKTNARTFHKCTAEDCNFKTFSKMYYKWHRKEFHSIYCSFCAYQCTEDEKLKNHITKHHSEKNKPERTLVCDICLTGFYDPKMFVYHKQLAHGFACQTCNHKCSSNDSLEFHIKTVHFTKTKKSSETTSKKPNKNEPKVIAAQEEVPQLTNNPEISNEKQVIPEPINDNTVFIPTLVPAPHNSNEPPTLVLTPAGSSSSVSGLMILNVSTLKPVNPVISPVIAPAPVIPNTLSISNVCNGNEAENLINSTPAAKQAFKIAQILNGAKEVHDLIRSHENPIVKKSRKKITPRREPLKPSEPPSQSEKVGEINKPDEQSLPPLEISETRKPKKKITPQRPPLEPSEPPPEEKVQIADEQSNAAQEINEITKTDPLAPEKAGEFKKPKKKFTPQRPFVETPETSQIQKPTRPLPQEISEVKRPKKKITPQRPRLEETKASEEALASFEFDHDYGQRTEPEVPEFHSTKPSLKRKLSIYLEKTVRCLDCQIIFCDFDELMKHHEEVHKITYTIAPERVKSKTEEFCLICSQGLTDDQLMAHLEVVHGITEQDFYICDVCGKSMYTKEIFSMHIRSHQRNLKRSSAKVACPICFERLDNNFTALNLHRMKMHAGGFDSGVRANQNGHFQCKKCKFGFNTLLAFETHKCSLKTY